MNQLETLLNTLIARGWKPWGKQVDKITIPPKEQFDEDRCLFIDIKFSNGFGTYRPRRELVSLESGLWQFCVEKGLCKGDIYERIKADLQILGAGESHQSDRDYQYRLIESALVPEEELGKFLVDNIKVEGK